VNERRPAGVMLVLAAVAAVSFVSSALLDVHGSWGQPRQAATNILWIVFLLSVLGLIVIGARLVVHRRTSTPG
jgi:H+/Cl- antiporter ClcA